MVTEQTLNQTSSQRAIARFSQSLAERGPHQIPAKRERSNQFHRIFSVKAGMRIVVAESPLEAHAIFWAEGEPSIATLCEQALRIHGPYGNRKHVTLDLSVCRKNDRETFYEIKPDASLVEHEDGRLLPTNWEYIEAWSIANGYDIQVMTSSWLSDFKIRIRNWTALLGFVRYFRINYDPNLEHEVYASIANSPGLSVHGLAEQLDRTTEHRITACVASLLHQGRLTGQLDEKPFNRFRELVVNE